MAVTLSPTTSVKDPSTREALQPADRGHRVGRWLSDLTGLALALPLLPVIFVGALIAAVWASRHSAK